MTDKTVESLDIESLGTVKLESGMEVEVPRLTNARVIRLAKFIATDGLAFAKDLGDVDKLNELEFVTSVITELEESQVAKLLNILFGLNESKAMQFDFVDTIELIQAFIDKTNIQKAFTIVQGLTKAFSRKQAQTKHKGAVNAAK